MKLETVHADIYLFNGYPRFSTQADKLFTYSFMYSLLIDVYILQLSRLELEKRFYNKKEKNIRSDDIVEVYTKRVSLFFHDISKISLHV